MTKRVLLAGVLASVLDAVRRELPADIEFVVATGVAEVRAVFREGDVDHVFIGGGLDLAVRAEVVREVFLSSDRATVHMKDQMSGPEGFGPFARAVLDGLRDYEPVLSPKAVLRARPPATPPSSSATGG